MTQTLEQLSQQKKSVLTIYVQGKLASTIDMEHSHAKKQYSLGRGIDNDIVVNSPIVSSQHAIFEIKEDGCYVYDSNSTNGLHINGKEVKNEKLEDGDNLRIDDVGDPHKDGILIIYSLLDNRSDERWSELLLEGQTVIKIGRESSSDIQIKHSSVSREHARVTKENNTYYLEDNQSTNGTFLNGLLVSGKAELNHADVIIIGDTKLIFQSKKIIYNVQSKGLRIDAIKITKDVKDSNSGMFKGKSTKRILDDISVSIKSGELVALIGGSGAGKSTFMDSLNGFRLPTEGSVLVNGDDFYSNYNAYKNIMGYVPQQDIVYDTLTVREMLTYAAKLRMPDDTTDHEIAERVKEVIKDVELEGREDLVIKQLSGGQRKRASIAVELLADPKLFFLDEPTSGLDPGMERNMMKLLRKLSDNGKTIILITHATANIHLCDKAVILGYGGKLCYFGPPNGALEFFKVQDYADIYDLINKSSDEWQKMFRESTYYSYHNSLVQKDAKIDERKTKSQSSSFRQFLILTSRYLKLTLIDKQRLAFLLLQAPFIALLLSFVAEKDAFELYETSKEVIFTVAASAVWIGLLNSLQEITKENDIYRRERAVNLQLGPYIFSKLVILGALTFVQSVAFVVALSFVMELPSKSLIGSVHLEFFIAFFLTTLAATTLGLVVSSTVGNSDRAMGLAPILLIPQLIFNGLVFKLEGFADFVSNLAISKWASRAISISIDLNDKPTEIETRAMVPPRDIPAYYNHDLSLLYQNWGILFGFSVLSIIISLIILKRKDKQ
ncbi:MAG: FHA domain-containing protein [Bacillaceae bacterium]|nr:FHA domain-containing protein [Bacillaceae bacterium]